MKYTLLLALLLSPAMAGEKYVCKEYKEFPGYCLYEPSHPCDLYKACAGIPTSNPDCGTCIDYMNHHTGPKPKPLTTRWVKVRTDTTQKCFERQHLEKGSPYAGQLFDYCNAHGDEIELGLRSDGLVYWRKR